MAGRASFNARKFKELVVHLAERSADDPEFGSTKLNKLLYFCDFEAYRQLGHSITGARYQKLEWGPAAKEFLPLQDEMLRDGMIGIEQQPRHLLTRRVTVPLIEPNLDVFGPEELALIDRMIAELRPLTGRAASDYSHEQSAGWQLAAEGEEISYATAGSRTGSWRYTRRSGHASRSPCVLSTGESQARRSDRQSRVSRESPRECWQPSDLLRSVRSGRSYLLDPSPRKLALRGGSFC